jgi:HSF-type DNA-binding
MNDPRQNQQVDENQVIGQEPFPLKLHALLEETEERGFSSIISWQDGNAFQVHNKDLFAEMVMPIYFDSTNYKTFQRNLNLWGFRTISKGPCKGEVSHALFIRGKPDLCRSMVRVRNKTNPPERFYSQPQHENAVVAAAGGNTMTSFPSSESLVRSSGTPTISSIPAPFSGMTGLGAALVALIKAQQQQQQQQQQGPPDSQQILNAPVSACPPAPTNNGGNSQSLAPALAALLQGLAGSGTQTNTVSTFSPSPPPPPPQTQPNLLFAQSQPQHAPMTPLNDQLLKLLALQQQQTQQQQQQHQQQLHHHHQQQQQEQANANSSPAMPCSDTATSVGSGSGNFPAVPGLPLMGTLQCQPAASGTTSSEERKPAQSPSSSSSETIPNLKPGSKLVACRARGMAMEHNTHVSENIRRMEWSLYFCSCFAHDDDSPFRLLCFVKTAYFEVTPDMSHGSDLVCSYPQCRNGGVKFLYCKYCDAVIARRSFRSQHLHSGEGLPSSCSNEPVAKRRKMGDYTTTTESVALVSNDGDSSSLRSSNHGNETAAQLEQVKKSWENMLNQRAGHKSQDDVSPWLMKILELSDRYVSLSKDANEE